MADWKTKALLAAVSLAIAAGTWAVNERDERLRQEGRAEVAEEAERALRDTLALARAHVVEVSVRADSVREASDSILISAERRIKELTAARPVLVDSIIVEAGPDSLVVREAVERVSASYELEVSDLRRALAAAGETMEVQDSLIQALRAKDRAQATLIANLETQIEGFRRTRPSWIERNVERVAWGAVGLAGGWALAGVVR